MDARAPLPLLLLVPRLLILLPPPPWNPRLVLLLGARHLDDDDSVANGAGKVMGAWSVVKRKGGPVKRGVSSLCEG